MIEVLSLFKGVIHVPTPLSKVIIAEVAAKHDLSVADLEGPSRARRIAHPRQEAMWELRRRTTLSLPNIGRRFGGRNHATILHGIRRHEARMGERT